VARKRFIDATADLRLAALEADLSAYRYNPGAGEL